MRKRGKPQHGMIAVLLLGLAGCTGLISSPTTGGADPLVGGPPPPMPGAARANQPAAPLAEAPVNSGGTSPAALATSVPRNSAGSDLRIPTPRGSGNEGWATAAPGVATASVAASGSGAVLRAPEAAGNAPPRNELSSVQPVSNSSQRDDSMDDQLQQQLNNRGFVYQKLEMTRETNLWKFTCMVPRKQDPKSTRTYTAQAADRITAMRAVLEQIDRDQ